MTAAWSGRRISRPPRRGGSVRNPRHRRRPILGRRDDAETPGHGPRCRSAVPPFGPAGRRGVPASRPKRATLQRAALPRVLFFARAGRRRGVVSAPEAPPLGSQA
jgi:hypothetical protein